MVHMCLTLARVIEIGTMIILIMIMTIIMVIIVIMIVTMIIINMYTASAKVIEIGSSREILIANWQ